MMTWLKSFRKPETNKAKCAATMLVLLKVKSYQLSCSSSLVVHAMTGINSFAPTSYEAESAGKR